MVSINLVELKKYNFIHHSKISPVFDLQGHKILHDLPKNGKMEVKKWVKYTENNKPIIESTIKLTPSPEAMEYIKNTDLWVT